MREFGGKDMSAGGGKEAVEVYAGGKSIASSLSISVDGVWAP